MPTDIYTEPDGDPDTLANLGPLRPMAGVWEGIKGADQHPIDGGAEADSFVEHYELQPIDFQTNGPQIFFGLQYHTRIVRPGEVAMFHQQVGFWLWEPNTHTVVLTLAIPRGQVALASGQCDPDATAFEVTAERGLTTYGIASNPFLDHNFTTTHFRMMLNPREWRQRCVSRWRSPSSARRSSCRWPTWTPPTVVTPPSTPTR